VKIYNFKTLKEIEDEDYCPDIKLIGMYRLFICYLCTCFPKDIIQSNHYVMLRYNRCGGK